MNARAREIELLALTALAAVPLYFGGAVGVAPLAVFHLSLALMVARIARGGSPEIIPEGIMRAVAIAYVPLYIVDAIANQLAIALDRLAHGDRDLHAAVLEPRPAVFEVDEDLLEAEHVAIEGAAGVEVADAVPHCCHHSEPTTRAPALRATP